MGIKINGSAIKTVRVNGSEIALVRLSGSTLYQKQRPILTGQLVVYPSGYNSSYSSYGGLSSITNAYTDAASTTRAQVTATTGSRAVSTIALTFDISSIPTNAAITNITCTVKAAVSNTSRFTTAVAQMYSGATAKGSSVSFRSTNTGTQYTVPMGSWTRAELSNINLRLTATRGTSSTFSSAYIYVYGATLTIDYSYTS